MNLTPIQNAINTISEKSSELRVEVQSKNPRAKVLQKDLSGVLLLRKFILFCFFMEKNRKEEKWKEKRKNVGKIKCFVVSFSFFEIFFSSPCCHCSFFLISI